MSYSEIIDAENRISAAISSGNAAEDYCYIKLMGHRY